MQLRLRRAQPGRPGVRAGRHDPQDLDELGNVAEVAELASLGAGSAIVPLSVADALDAGRPFRVLPLSDPLARQPISLVFPPPGRRSEVARAFVEVYRAFVGPAGP